MFDDGRDDLDNAPYREALTAVVSAAIGLNADGPYEVDDNKPEPPPDLQGVEKGIIESLTDLTSELDTMSTGLLMNVHCPIAALVYSSLPSAFRHARTIIGRFVEGLSEDTLENLSIALFELRKPETQLFLKALEDLVAVEARKRGATKTDGG